MLVSESAAGGLQMQRDRVMDAALDLFAQQRRPDRVAPIAADDKQMVTRLDARRVQRAGSSRRAQSVAINRGELRAAARSIPSRCSNLATQHRRLDEYRAARCSRTPVSVMRMRP